MVSIYRATGFCGRRVVETPEGVFVAVRCPVHGETFHRITVIGDAEARTVSQSDRDTASEYNF